MSTLKLKVIEHSWTHGASGSSPWVSFKLLDKSHEPYECHKSLSFQYSQFVSRGLVVSKPGWDSRDTGYKPLVNFIYFWIVRYNSEPEAQVQDIPSRGRVLTGCVTKPGEARTVQGHRQQQSFQISNNCFKQELYSKDKFFSVLRIPRWYCMMHVWLAYIPLYTPFISIWTLVTFRTSWSSPSLNSRARKIFQITTADRIISSEKLD